MDGSRGAFSDQGPLSVRGLRSKQVRSSWFHSQDCASSGQDKTSGCSELGAAASQKKALNLLKEYRWETPAGQED